MKSKFLFPIFLFAIFPLLFVPVWAYINGNLHMLLGILASYAGSLCLFKKRGVVVLIIIGVFIVYNILEVPVFHFRTVPITVIICLLYGYLTAAMYQNIEVAEKYKREVEGAEEEE